MITRFAVLPDDRRVLMGVDKANLFEAGFVYEAVELLGQIVIKKIGKYALAKQGPEYPNENSDNESIMYYGMHLLTQEEEKEIYERRQDNK